MSRVQSGRVTEAEFLSLPESMDKVELIDGEVVVSPSPSLAHQIIVQRLLHALMSWVDGQEAAISVGHGPLDIRFGPDRILQPDVFVILDRVPFRHRGPLDRVPELCIEVISGNRTHDRVTKRFLYAAAGVREYWIIDPVGIVERWRGPGLDQGEEATGSLATRLLPGFTLELARVFAEE